MFSRKKWPALNNSNPSPLISRFIMCGAANWWRVVVENSVGLNVVTWCLIFVVVLLLLHSGSKAVTPFLFQSDSPLLFDGRWPSSWVWLTSSSDLCTDDLLVLLHMQQEIIDTILDSHTHILLLAPWSDYYANPGMPVFSVVVRPYVRQAQHAAVVAVTWSIVLMFSKYYNSIPPWLQNYVVLHAKCVSFPTWCSFY